MRKQEHFVPDTSGVRGSMHGYDPEDAGVTEQNVQAVIAEFFDYESLVVNGATESWPAFWKYVHSSEEFWWNYYCQKAVEVQSKLKGGHHGDVICEWMFGSYEDDPSKKYPRFLSDPRGPSSG